MIGYKSHSLFCISYTFFFLNLKMQILKCCVFQFWSTKDLYPCSLTVLDFTCRLYWRRPKLLQALFMMFVMYSLQPKSIVIMHPRYWVDVPYMYLKCIEIYQIFFPYWPLEKLLSKQKATSLYNEVLKYSQNTCKIKCFKDPLISCTWSKILGHYQKTYFRLR